jgi:transcriptional regulator GlxA family with amidase domain
MEVIASDDRRSDVVTPDLTIGFVLIPDFTLLAFAGFVDALRIASDVGDRSRQIRCRWSLVGPDLRPVRSSCGVTISHNQTFGDPGDFDYIAVIGGLLGDDRLYDHATLAYLRRAASQGVPLVGVCTGVFVLARAGLLDGYRCCVHGYHDSEFEQDFPNASTVTDQIIVADRDRLTCAGGSAAIDLAAMLIERHCGKDRALKILPHLVVDEIRAPDHAQLPMVDDYFHVFDDRVRKAVFIMEQHMNNPPPIGHIAGRVGSSIRQLERGFRRSFGVTPQTYYRTMRLKHGRWLLTHTTRSVTQIAYDCGFADASHFSRCFKRAFRQVPTALRQVHTTR